MRAIGASNYTAEQLSEALKVSQELGLPRYETMQPQYNLYDRSGYEGALERVCEQNGLGVISYYSLASGFLTGKYRSEADLTKSPRGQGVKKYLNERGLRILKALDEVANKYHSTPARVSLAWLIARPSITAPIASSTNLDQLNDLVGATKLQLDRTSIELLDQASEEKTAKPPGDAAHFQHVGRAGLVHWLARHKHDAIARRQPSRFDKCPLHFHQQRVSGSRSGCDDRLDAVHNGKLARHGVHSL